MKAIVYRRFGSPDVLESKEIPKPVPRDHEVLIKVRATTVSAADWRARSLDVPRGFGLVARLVFGFSRPRHPVLGMEVSGEIESVGKAVRAFKPGDLVFGFTSTAFGCHAEYTCMPEGGALAPKPANLTHEEAAALTFGGLTARAFFRAAKLREGEEVLINGASGAVGSAAVQLARHFGAKVTGVCSTGNLELVRALGADEVIDYTKEDFTRSGKTYDVILDTAGTAPFPRSQGSLKAKGRFLAVLATLPDILRAPWVSLTSSKRVIAGHASWSVEDVRFLAGLAESGRFKPVIGRRYSLDQIVEAHRWVDTGHKTGNVVIAL